jgi:argininosuccinate lyase
MVSTLSVREERLTAAAGTGHALATDVAEWLVRSGVAFRDAHEITGRLVRWCDEHDRELWEVGDDELTDVDERLTPDVRTVLSVRGALASRSTVGGTAPVRVAEQLAELADAASRHAAWATGAG